MPLRLDSTNYVLWKYQVSSILKSHSLFGHIDNYLPCPPKFYLHRLLEPPLKPIPSIFNGSPVTILSSSTAGTTPETNPKHLQWLSRDQALITLINTTLSPSALAHVVGSTSSKSLWFSLEKRYSSNTISNILDLISALYTIKKNTSKTIEQYTS
ncbi:Retrovirus-related Pol polyprotein from transposon TNT 1-94 [Cucumis melo var. makuwa]|uniref:Retrovirus-related Pol polyprotein from transposon TNT 1-94 n=1 Tax=Cucumis melo var. makuwa TaxID=1194695 RepID=A0A5D3BA60_CUCMM|nr:Retrovirus-related Pol polyprotein from transposon TNT 1-94 [Cucumis melo var. makuwa]TYJ95834.1 Retrovirus-related Pol polyprotein from transposon TNT 1-94 [Cucumis melo var. makuwa]